MVSHRYQVDEAITKTIEATAWDSGLSIDNIQLNHNASADISELHPGYFYVHARQSQSLRKTAELLTTLFETPAKEQQLVSALKSPGPSYQASLFGLSTGHPYYSCRFWGRTSITNERFGRWLL
ncbi:MAG: hypothetical protein AAGD25_32685 [Cyanobacteria bacterium P01_F01_bin.150]